MNFFNFFSKKSPDNSGNGSPNDSKSKSSIKLKFEIQPTNELETLNTIIKKFSYETLSFENYDDYMKVISSIIENKLNGGPKKFYLNELDYRFETKNPENKISNKNTSEANILKMKEVGKIFVSNQTTLDKSLIGQSASLTFNDLKIENLQNFTSIKSSNCLTSGKWCYEVTLVTSGLMQLGFCQLLTNFTRQEGVGDDNTSFAYDGYRKVKWNKERKEYGKIWDIGDVIGVCLDFEKQNIEYFFNGQSLGIAFNGIHKGANVAFFPGVSLAKGEGCIFNFGQLPFKYKYKDYKGIDISMTKVNGEDVVIKNLLKLWKNNVLPRIIKNELSDYQNLLLSFNIFYYVSIYIKDMNVFHTVILPFLIDVI